MTLNAPHGDDSAVPASSDFSGTIATPMRDRLLCAVAAASPCSKGKMPMQLPPPPPGMPASQVEKWRKEVAKIVSKQQKEEMKVLKQREKEEDRLKREEEKMRAKVEALAKKMQQQALNMRRSQPEVPLTQCESPDDSPESSPRSDPLGYHQTVDDQAGVGTDAGQQEECVQRPVASQEADAGIENDTNKENTPVVRMATVATINAAEEVSKVLAARRQRVEQAMQTNERHKEELACLPVNRKQREALAGELEKRELQSFEQRIPNKKKAQELEEQRILEGEEQRKVKEILVAGQNVETSLLDELNKKRKSMSERIEQCAASQQSAKQSGEIHQTAVKSPPRSAELDTGEIDYVIDEIPVPPLTVAKRESPSEPCGIGIMIAQDNVGRFVIIRILPTGSAARSKLLHINDIIESIDGQAIKGMRPESVGNMIRGDSGSQVVLDIVSGPNHLRTRVGITRSPVDSSQSVHSAAPSSTVVQQDIPIQLNRPKTERMAPIAQLELSDYDAPYASVKSYAPPAPSTPVAPPAVVPGAIYTLQSSADRCGVGLGFEFQPSRGVLVLRAIDSQIESPFQLGDYLVEVNGTCVASNSMLAPSLLWGDAGTCINLKMMRGHEAPRQIDATIIRKSSWLDSNLITMAGGGKTCGIGVVLETEANSGCFYIKRVVHGGPASSAGVLNGDLVTHIDGKDMRAFTKEQLPSLILGQEGSLLSMRLLRAGEAQPREIIVMRFLDTAKAQQSNLASSAILTFDYIESVGSPVEVETFSCSLQADIVIALQTVSKRIEVVSVSLHHGLANVYVLPDFEGGDTRSVEELVREFVHQASTQHSVLRKKMTCKSLSRINVLGQVDPQQPRLDLDKFNSFPVMQTPAEFGSNTLRQDQQESRVLCLSTSAATRSAAPADDLVGFPDITSATTSHASEKVEEVKVQTAQTVADANILSLKVLTVVRAAPPAVHYEDDSTEARDVSPVVSPVLSPEPEGAPVESTQESIDESNSSHPDGVPSEVPAPEHDMQAPDPTNQGRAVEDAGTAEPHELETTKLALGRKLLACLGHPEVNLVVGETQSAGPADEEPEYPNPEDSETSSSQLGGGDANTQECAEEATAEAAAPQEPPTPCPLSSQWQDEHTQIFAKEATADEVAKEVPAAKTSTETAEVSAVRTKSLRLVGVPAGCDVCAEDLCSMEIPTPAADVHVGAHTDNKSEAKISPRDGSALQAIESLEPSLSLADGVLSVKRIPAVDETARSAVEQAMHENLLLLQAIGTHAALDCDAWADEVSVHDRTNTHDATRDLPEVRAPPRPSRKVDAAQRNSVPSAQKVPPARPPRGFDATGASAKPPIKAVSTVTDRSTPAEKAMDVAPEEVQELHEKFPNRIPVVVGKAAFSIAPEVQSKKYLVPANVTLKNFHILISKRVDSLPEDMHLVLSVAGRPILESGHRKLRDLYEAQQRSKGILEVVYDVEEGEVNITQDLDESVQMGSDAFYPHEEDESNSQSTSPVKIPVQPPKRVSSFPDSTHWQLKNWISLDVGPDDNDESISPLSLLIGLGSNLKQMAMPNPPNNAAEAAITPPGYAGSFVAEFPVATIHSQTSQPPGKEPATQGSVVQAGIGLKIERDVGGKGFRITGVAPEGPAGKNGAVKVNDYLIAVDKVVVKDKKTDEAANLLKGPESSTVQLTLRRAEKIHTVTLIRALVAKQGKVQDKPVVAPQVAKSDKVQIFGFAF